MRTTRTVVTALILGSGGLACDSVPTELSQHPAAAAPQFSRSSTAAGTRPVMAPLPTGLVPCAPLPPLTLHQRIGPEGGTIVLGPHTLVIPPGALARTRDIEAEIRTVKAPIAKAPRGRAPRPGFEVVNAVRFKPHLRFRTPASLTLSYANCDVLPPEAVLPAVVYTNPVMNVIHEVETSIDDGETRTVTASISHFSNYAVAW